MKQDILTQFPWPVLPTIALLLFFAFFVGLIVRVSQSKYKDNSRIGSMLPLHDGEKYE